MKNNCLRSVLFVFIGCILFACGQQSGASGIEVDFLWSDKDLEAMGEKAKTFGGPMLSYKVTLQIKPPFYQGETPLEYISAGKSLGGGILGSMGSMILVHDFGAWRNMFIYGDQTNMLYGMPDGAVAVDNEKNILLAECKVTKALNEGQRLSGFELVENHFNDQGIAIFHSRFSVDFQNGFKIKEFETKGRKEREYFFIWPVGLSAGF